jgi:hypothetical protein
MRRGQIAVAPRLWLVSPVFQDVEAYLVLRERLREIIDMRRDLQELAVRFVVVDDTAGFDAQIEKLQSFEDVTVISGPFNLGHQRALVYGLRTIGPMLADDDMVVTLDADGEDQPEDLPRLLGPLLDAPGDLQRVSAALRTKRRTSFRFKIMYLFFRILFRLLTGTSVRTGNFAAYRGWLARRILIHPSFDMSYSSALLSLNLPIAYVPCERGERIAGHSRMGFKRLFVHGLRMMMPFIDRIAVRALVLFSVTLALGVLMGIIVIAIRAFTSTAVPGWATSALIGMTILSFVALGNFITLFAIYSQSHGISLADIERAEHGPSGSPSSPSDRSL